MTHKHRPAGWLICRYQGKTGEGKDGLYKTEDNADAFDEGPCTEIYSETMRGILAQSP